MDSDLAKLYQCSNGTKTINQAVKRHGGRFPKRFMFQLTEEEFLNLQSQVGTANYNKVRTLPYVFTEQGVAMLSAVLRTSVAEEVSVAIMDAFVLMKKYISSSLTNQKYYNDMIVKHDTEIKLLQESFEKIKNKEDIITTYYNGQIYDAYSKIIEIFKEAKKELIIIDGYADKTLLDMIKKLKANVILITRKKGLLSKLDIEKYNKQYNNLKVIYDNTYHDRYFINDKKEIYHSGTSINHAGNKTFSINKWNDKLVIENFIKNLSNVLK